MTRSTVLYADLITALEKATRVWGDELRQECQRVGGPRHTSSSSATIDAELELRIRETLQQLTPSAGIPSPTLLLLLLICSIVCFSVRTCAGAQGQDALAQAPLHALLRPPG